MMSGAEGAEGLYLQKPKLEEFESLNITREKFVSLLYEICVQSGEIRIEGNGESKFSLDLSIFWPGKHVRDWRESKLKVSNLEEKSQS